MKRVYASKPLEDRNMHTLSVPVSQRVMDELKRLAQDCGVTKTELARDLIADGLRVMAEGVRT